MNRFVRLTLLSAAAAAITSCNDATSPAIDPPPPAVASIRYTTDAALVFTKDVVPIRALVKAFDAAGNELPSSRLSLTLPTGWSLRNDSIVAPTSEGNWRLKAVAKSSTAANLDQTDVGDSSVVTAALDLGDFNWAATYKCIQPPNVKVLMAGPNNAFVDSILYSVAVDSVSYSANVEGGVYLNYGGIAAMWFHGTFRRYVRDGGDSTGTFADRIPIRSQAPDSIVFDPFLGTLSNGKQFFTRSGDTYTGGSWCPSVFVTEQGFVRGATTVTRAAKNP